jgi:hypothetical protein
VKKPGLLIRCLAATLLTATLVLAFLHVPTIAAQAVPYARTFLKSNEEVDLALKELQAYAGQKLPIVDGFVASVDQPLARYERAFYQFSVELVPGVSGGTVVSVTAKITAWYADRDPSKSGYQVLPSNGRLELDLLDRLGEKLNGKPLISVSHSSVQAPTPKLDLSATSAGSPLTSGKSAPAPSGTVSGSGGDDVAALRRRREAEEKHMQQLNSELQSLLDIQHSQAHPGNLVVVKKQGTPVFAKSSGASRVLFTAALDDEFEFLDAEGEWIHVQISGLSRGYIRRSSLDLPELIAAKLKSPNGNSTNEKLDAFRVEREETATFPGSWETLRGKRVKIYTVQAVSQDSKETTASARLKFAASLFQRFLADLPVSEPEISGVVLIFDSADGGIIGATLEDIRQMAGGALSRDNFWKHCFLDPPEAFRAASNP